MSRMSRKKHPISILIALAVAALSLSACGRTTTEDNPGNTAAVTPVIPPFVPSVVPTPTPTPTPTGGFMPAYTFAYNLTGQSGTADTYTTPVISTDNKLTIRVNSGPAGQLSVPGVYSNFTANYSCISYTVSVLGRTVVTQTLSVSGGDQLLTQCPGAPTSQVIDFSDRLGPGHGPVTVSVSSARYDFYCQLWFRGWVPGDYYMYCPLRTVYKNHTVSGSLDIQVNGTTL